MSKLWKLKKTQLAQRKEKKGGGGSQTVNGLSKFKGDSTG